MRNCSFGSIFALALLACGGHPVTVEKPTTAAVSMSGGIDTVGMDANVRPGDDFFAYANGSWTKTAEIPPDRSSWGTGGIVAERTAKRTVELIQAAAASNAPPGSDARKVGDYYATFMDEAEVEKRALEPLRPTMSAILAIKDTAALSRYLGANLRAEVDILNATELDTDHLFGLWVAQDLDEPTKYAPFLLQGGLELPDRDYYLSAEPRMRAIREKYVAHIATVLRLAKIEDADGKAARIFAFEKKIAEAHATREESEDVEKGNNHWARADLAAKAPGIDWNEFLSAAALSSQPTFVVWQPRAFTKLSALAKNEPLDTWKEFLLFHALERHASFLPKVFVDEKFAFYDKTLNGTERIRDRWKRAVQQTDLALGEIVGKLYVEKYFPASEKARAEKMVKDILLAFGNRIDQLSWMAPETKKEAKAKLAALKVGVGYPNKWRDYSKLEVVRGDALGNFMRATSFEYARNIAKLGTPVDRDEWVMNPQLVNAVNLPAMNALNFPAAILQPPDFDPSRPIVMDYGATGAIIGHEICHSFDNMGSLFDAKGRLRNWWTPEDLAHFKAASQSLATQFDAYEPFPATHVNGKLTLGENIADVAGLNAAYDAYRIAYGGKEAPAAQGLRGDQQFFVSFAQAWRYKIREPAARERLLTDVHAPAQYRADTVRNVDAWYAAFSAKPGEKLHLAPSERVRVY